MKSFRPLLLKKIDWLLLPVILVSLTTVCPAVAALTARDLIVVFNRNLPESQAVAAYYAVKRRVPADHLVGVAVPTSEDMSRQDFEEKLTPPVRVLVDRLQAQGRTPAILLVYGIPLRVGPPAPTPADKAFKELASAKVDENKKLVLHAVNKLNQSIPSLPGKPVWKTRAQNLTYPAPQVLVMAQQAVSRGGGVFE